MGKRQDNPSHHSLLPLLRGGTELAAVSRSIPIAFRAEPTVVVRVRPRGERRRDHRRRYCFRGLDELRRQQAGREAPEPAANSLDVLL
jgi:hypothetical protein